MHGSITALCKIRVRLSRDGAALLCSKTTPKIRSLLKFVVAPTPKLPRKLPLTRLTPQKVSGEMADQPCAPPTAKQARQVTLPELALSEAEVRQATALKNQEDTPRAREFIQSL